MKKHIDNKAIKWGIDNENQAKNLFAKKNNLKIIDSGFLIDFQLPFLGGSPDGFIVKKISHKLKKEELIEVKCPYSKRH